MIRTGRRVLLVAVAIHLISLGAAAIWASRPLLPADTRWVAIEGGNHAQFGR